MPIPPRTSHAPKRKQTTPQKPGPSSKKAKPSELAVSPSKGKGKPGPVLDLNMDFDTSALVQYIEPKSVELFKEVRVGQIKYHSNR
jgi:hypothetical protein